MLNTTETLHHGDPGRSEVHELGAHDGRNAPGGRVCLVDILVDCAWNPVQVFQSLCLNGVEELESEKKNAVHIMFISWMDFISLRKKT